jgi:spermidine/putrescine-binding protein
MTLLLTPFIAQTAGAAAAEEQPAALKKVIEAAKKEGKVNFMSGSHVYDGAKIAQGIKNKFGVDLQINVIPGDQRKTMSTAAMEIKAGATPSYDVMEVAGPNVLTTMMPGGMIAAIDWKSLFTKDIDPQVLLPPPANFPSTSCYIETVAYNAAKVAAQDIPKSFKEMTDPKYSGKFGWIAYGAVNAELIYFSGLGETAGLQLIKDIVKNKPMMHGWSDLADKLRLGEVRFTILASHEYNRIAAQDPNFKWNLPKDRCLVSENTTAVLKGAANQNAATLLVLYFLTPEGRKYTFSTAFGHYLEPESNEYKMVAEAKKNGIPIIYAERNKDYCEWLLSPKSLDLQKQADMILKGAVK